MKNDTQQESLWDLFWCRNSKPEDSDIKGPGVIGLVLMAIWKVVFGG